MIFYIFPVFYWSVFEDGANKKNKKITLLHTKRIAYNHQMSRMFLFQVKITCMPYLTDQREKDSEMNVSVPIFFVSAD